MKEHSRSSFDEICSELDKHVSAPGTENFFNEFLPLEQFILRYQYCYETKVLYILEIYLLLIHHQQMIFSIFKGETVRQTGTY